MPKGCQTAKCLSSNAAKICLTKFHLTKPLRGWTKCDKVSSGIRNLWVIFPNKSFLINDHAKIQSSGKLQGCCSLEITQMPLWHLFSNFLYTLQHKFTTCDRYLGQQLIKLSTCTKWTAKKRSIRKLIQGPEVQLPREQQSRSCNIPSSRTFTNSWIIGR